MERGVDKMVVAVTGRAKPCFPNHHHALFSKGKRAFYNIKNENLNKGNYTRDGISQGLHIFREIIHTQT